MNPYIRAYLEKTARRLTPEEFTREQHKHMIGGGLVGGAIGTGAGTVVTLKLPRDMRGSGMLLATIPFALAGAIFGSVLAGARRWIKGPYLQEKKAAIPRSVAIPAVGALVAGGLAVSDALKAKGLGEARILAKQYIGGGQKGTVSIPKEVGGRKVRVISTKRQVRSMRPDLPLGFITAPLARGMARKQLGAGSAAYVLKGKGEDYIIAGKSVPKEVMQHEIGHLIKGHHLKSLGLMTGLPLRIMLYKPTYRKHIIQREREAWRNVPDSSRKRKMQKVTEETYEKTFHEGRAILLATLSGLFGYSTAMMLLSKGRQR